MEKVSICVTGAAGSIGYSLVFRIANGEVFGPNTSLDLRLLELPLTEEQKQQEKDPLEALKMELEDCAYPLLRRLVTTTSEEEAFKDVDWAILVGAVPRKKGMERKDLLEINAKTFAKQGTSIDQFAKADCRVLVVGNPCNTNALIVKTVSKRLSAKNVYALTRLDENRSKGMLAKKAAVDVKDVKNAVVWGNHSSTLYPDFYNAQIKGKKAVEVVDENWLKTAFIEGVQQRGAEVIKKRGASSAASAANAVVNTLQSILRPTPEGEAFSLALFGDGDYDVDSRLIFGYPVTSDGHRLSIVKTFDIPPFSKEKLKLTEKELLEEREIALAFLKKNGNL